MADDGIDQDKVRWKERFVRSARSKLDQGHPGLRSTEELAFGVAIVYAITSHVAGVMFRVRRDAKDPDGDKELRQLGYDSLRTRPDDVFNDLAALLASRHTRAVMNSTGNKSTSLPHIASYLFPGGRSAPQLIREYQYLLHDVSAQADLANSDYFITPPFGPERLMAVHAYMVNKAVGGPVLKTHSPIGPRPVVSLQYYLTELLSEIHGILNGSLADMSKDRGLIGAMYQHLPAWGSEDDTSP